LECFLVVRKRLAVALRGDDSRSHKMGAWPRATRRAGSRVCYGVSGR